MSVVCKGRDSTHRGERCHSWDLSQFICPFAVRLLTQIALADLMILAVKAGARADGFVLGMEAVGALRAGEAENLYMMFEAALEKQLKSLSG